jgi:hypothetical protein
MMRELDTTIIQKRATEPEEVHDEFRCWISAEPHPIGLLHMSIKVTNEAPAGIRAGLNGVRVAHPGRDLGHLERHLAHSLSHARPPPALHARPWPRKAALSDLSGLSF